MMQRLGERLDEEEQYAVKEMHADRTQGEKIIPVLFEEMDGTSVCTGRTADYM